MSCSLCLLVARSSGWALVLLAGCAPGAGAVLSWRLCSWRWSSSLACGFGVSFSFPSAWAPSRGPVFPQVSSSMFWDFGSGYALDGVRVGWSCTARRVRRCGVTSYALSRQPYFSSMSLRRLRLRVAAQANRTSQSRCFCNSRRSIASSRGGRIRFPWTRGFFLQK